MKYYVCRSCFEDSKCSEREEGNSKRRGLITRLIWGRVDRPTRKWVNLQEGVLNDRCRRRRGNDDDDDKIRRIDGVEEWIGLLGRKEWKK